MVGIVASRIVERYHRPAVLIALDGDAGTGSGRSIPGFDLLGALTTAAEHLERYGGHRAAAGLTIERASVERLPRRLRSATPQAVLTPDLLEPEERIDAIASGADLGLALAEELARARAVRDGQSGAAAARPRRPLRRRPADGRRGVTRASRSVGRRPGARGRLRL